MRALKPQKVADVRSASGRLRLDVYLDRNSLDFFAEAGGKTVRGATIDECKKLARQLATDMETFSWEPFIEIELKDDSRTIHMRNGRYDTTVRAGLELSFRRFERALSPGETDKYVTRQHTADFLASSPSASAVKEREQNRRTDNFWAYEEHRYIPYSEEVWQGLLRIQQVLDALRARVDEMMKDDDVIGLLTGIGRNGMPLLPAGSADDTTKRGEDE